MTVHHAKSFQVNHLVLCGMCGTARFDVVLGEITLFGDGVGNLLDSFGNFLTEGTVGFANPVTGASQDRLDRAKNRHNFSPF